MARFKITRAQSPAEIRAHLRKRWLIFGKEEGYLSGRTAPNAMEFDSFDALVTALHFNIVVETEAGHDDHRLR